VQHIHASMNATAPGIVLFLNKAKLQARQGMVH